MIDSTKFALLRYLYDNQFVFTFPLNKKKRIPQLTAPIIQDNLRYVCVLRLTFHDMRPRHQIIKRFYCVAKSNVHHHD